MPVTLLKVLRQFKVPPFAVKEVEFNGTDDYQTGGEIVLAAEFGMSSIEMVDVVGGMVDSSGDIQRTVLAVLPLQTPSPSQAGGKVMPSVKFVITAVGGAEVAGASDQSGFRARAFVWGDGS